MIISLLKQDGRTEIGGKPVSEWEFWAWNFRSVALWLVHWKIFQRLLNHYRATISEGQSIDRVFFLVPFGLKR